MKHTTNYYNTFIEVAEDCPTEIGIEPPVRNQRKTIALRQFELIKMHPYTYTSDDVFFKVFAIRNDLPNNELASAREGYFSKGQPCFRASPLTKKYGWGVHCNAVGKVAIYARETEDYQNFVEDSRINKVKAMRSRKK